ncbi:MAG: M28 family peptidase [Saprospiraceae bacterium]|nr:M28 family peptidase [Saprospiraceae bacterium]HMX89499.1 M28 family peptidase [Saprospiraceae bacterium]HNC36360.1 M28 family peptidase [Saprospiraceae bacterium]HNG69620.1 M28 family peptidase [Saprospiraceae bacterium]
MMKKYCFILLLLLGFKSYANRIPQITQCDVRIENQTLVVSYEMSDAEDSQLEVRCRIIFKDGPNRNKEVAIQSTQGDIGWPITPGSNKSIRIILERNTDLSAALTIILSAYDRQPLRMEELLADVSGERIKNDMLALQGKRNESTDKAFKEQARAYIRDILSIKDYLNSYESKVGSLTNINYESTRWGTAQSDSLEIIDAHYDSYGQAPGADDNASGTCGVLEAYRVLAPYASKKSMRFILFDLEENGLVGSNLYVNNQLPVSDHIDNVINFEMIGYYSEMNNTQDLPAGFNILFPDAYNKVIANNRRGDFINNIGNTTSKSLIGAFQTTAESFVPELKLLSLEVPGNGSIAPDLRRSDHASFWDKGYRALMITDGANFRNKNYHTPRDSAQYLDYAFMNNVIKTSIATLALLAGVEHGTSAAITFTPSVSTRDLKNSLLDLYQGGRTIYITGQDKDDIQEIILINSTGQTFRMKLPQGQNQFTINSNYPPGMYFILFNATNSKLIHKIFVSE